MQHSPARSNLRLRKTRYAGVQTGLTLFERLWLKWLRLKAVATWPPLLYLGGSAVLWRLIRVAAHPHRKLQNMLSFMLSMLPSELAPQMLVLQGLAAFAFVRWFRRSGGTVSKLSDVPSRAVGVPVALASLALNAASAFKLAGMARQALQSTGVFRSAFRSAGVPSPSLEHPWSAARAACAVVPVPQILGRNIEVKRGIVYANLPSGRRPDSPVKPLKLDLYWHSARKMENAPVFLYIHGGGWVTGHRMFASLPLLYEVAREGWLVVSINYRLAPRATVREQLADCKLAMKWIRDNAARYGADGNFVVCSGESAGGHLASMLALTPHDPSLQPGFEDVDTSVKGCVDLYGVHNFKDDQGHFADRDDGAMIRFLEDYVVRHKLESSEDVFESMSPVHRLRRRHTDDGQVEDEAAGDAAGDVGASGTSQRRAFTSTDKVPPFLIVHGSHDTLVPIEDAQHFAQALEVRRAEDAERRRVDGGGEAGEGGNGDDAEDARDVYVELPGAHHAFNYLPSTRTLSLGRGVADFLSYVRQYAAQHRPRSRL